MWQKNQLNTEGSRPYPTSVTLLLSRNKSERAEIEACLGQFLMKRLLRYPRLEIIAKFVEDQNPPIRRD